MPAQITNVFFGVPAQITNVFGVRLLSMKSTKNFYLSLLKLKLRTKYIKEIHITSFSIKKLICTFLNHTRELRFIQIQLNFYHGIFSKLISNFVPLEYRKQASGREAK